MEWEWFGKDGLKGPLENSGYNEHYRTELSCLLSFMKR